MYVYEVWAAVEMQISEPKAHKLFTYWSVSATPTHVESDSFDEMCSIPNLKFVNGKPPPVAGRNPPSREIYPA